MANESAQNDNAVSKALNMLKRIRRLDGTALISGGVYLHEDCPRGADLKMFLQSTVQMFDGYSDSKEIAKEILLGFEDGDILFIFRYPVILCLFLNREEDLHSLETGGNQFLHQFGSILGIKEQPSFEPPIMAPDWTDAQFLAALTGSPGAPVIHTLNGESESRKKPVLNIPKTDSPSTPNHEIKPVSEEKIRPITKVDPPKEKKDFTESSTGKKATRAVHLDSTQSIRLMSSDTEWGEFLCLVEILFTKVIGSAQARTNITRELEALDISEEKGLEKSEYLSFGQKLTGRIKDRKVRRLIENELNTLIKDLTT